MIFKFKSTGLLICGALFCLSAASCGNSASSTEQRSEGISTDLEAIELGADPVAAAEKSTSASTATRKARGEWDGEALMYNDDPRHLFWDISTFQNWDIVDEDRIPEDMLFAAINDDYNIVVTLSAIPIVDQSITSVWEMPKDKVLEKSMEVQNEVFPGSKNGEPRFEKVQFRNKSAYQYTFDAEVPDNRHDETVILPYHIRIVDVVSDHELIQLVVMLPQEIIDRFGDDAYNMLIGKFNFVDPQ